MASRLAATLRASLFSAGYHTQDVVIVALSGGADSMALLHLLRELLLPSQIVVVHVDHGLRPESHEEARQLVSYVEGLGLRCALCTVTVSPVGKGIEEAARRARYEALAAVAAREKARVVLTGHTQDDQAETVIWQLLRGGGSGALVGMPKERPLGEAVLLRPLLGVRRARLREYLVRHGVSWLEDPSNALPVFTRNRIRASILPLLLTENLSLVESLALLAEEQQELHEEITLCAESLVSSCASRESETCWNIFIPKLLTLRPRMRIEVMRCMLRVWKILPSQGQLSSLQRLLESKGGSSVTLACGVTARRTGSQLVLTMMAT